MGQSRMPVGLRVSGFWESGSGAFDGRIRSTHAPVLGIVYSAYGMPGLFGSARTR